MNDNSIVEHGIMLDLVGKTSIGEILNTVLRKQQGYFFEITLNAEEE